MSLQPPVDFLILPALLEEQEALRDAFELPRLDPGNGDPRIFFGRNVSVQLPSGIDGEYSVVLSSAIGMGQVDAAALAGRVIAQWSPRCLLLVGIAGGIAKRHVALGDVLVATQVIYYELARLSKSGNKTKYKAAEPDPLLLSAAQSVRSNEWQRFVTCTPPKPHNPRVHFGTIATGDKVIARISALNTMLKIWPDLLGVEMEAYGVAKSAKVATDPPKFLMIRGVSDHADDARTSRRVSSWRAFACAAPAAFARGLLESCPIAFLRIASDDSHDRRTTDAVIEAIREALGPVRSSTLFADVLIQTKLQVVKISIRIADTLDEHALWCRSITSTVLHIGKRISSEMPPFDLSEKAETMRKARHSKAQEAREFYATGRSQWNTRSKAGMQRALRCFRSALRVDRRYSLAYAAISDTYNVQADYYHAPANRAFKDAKAAARRALSIDKRLAEARAALGKAIHLSDWNWKRAAEEFERAIVLDNTYAPGFQWYAECQASLGRFDRAFTLMSRAQELDPHSAIISTNVGWIMYFMGRYDEAIKHYRNTRRIFPCFGLIKYRLGMALVMVGKFEAALREFGDRTSKNDEPWMLAARGYVFGVTNRTRRALGQLKRLQRTRSPRSYHQALIHVGMGNCEAAFRCLKTALRHRDRALAYLGVEPFLQGLRSETRFRELLSEVGLPVNGPE